MTIFMREITLLILSYIKASRLWTYFSDIIGPLDLTHLSWPLSLSRSFYNSVLILRASQLGALIKYTNRFEGKNIVSNQTNLISTSNKHCCKYIVSNRMNLIRTSNKHCCKYNRVILSSFGQTNQLTKSVINFHQNIIKFTKITPLLN